MPIVKVSTNLARNQLPEAFMQNFTRKLANILEKHPGRMTWKLETDQLMSLLVIWNIHSNRFNNSVITNIMHIFTYVS